MKREEILDAVYVLIPLIIALAVAAVILLFASGCATKTAPTPVQTAAAPLKRVNLQSVPIQTNAPFVSVHHYAWDYRRNCLQWFIDSSYDAFTWTNRMTISGTNTNFMFQADQPRQFYRVIGQGI